MEKKDLLEEVLKEEFVRLAKEEEDVIQKEDISMSEEMMEDLYEEIQGKIHEEDKYNIYAQLSEEDLKALELGRRIMEEEVRAEREAKIVRKKKRVRMCISLAAALILAMAIGVTSMGGPERIIQMMTRMIGDREVVQIDSEDNLVLVEEEEEAYQKVSNICGNDIVRVFRRPKGLKFDRLIIDEESQISELIYEYEGETIMYIINTSYMKDSWGIGVEDELIDVYQKEVGGIVIEVKEYMIRESGLKRYFARFKYKRLEYILIGTMDKEDFEFLLENLYFYHQ